MPSENKYAHTGEPPIPSIIDIMDGTNRHIHGFICPQCGNQVTRYVHTKFCPHCHQKLLWSDLYK